MIHLKVHGTQSTARHMVTISRSKELLANIYTFVVLSFGLTMEAKLSSMRNKMNLNL
jgi:hypothetical protein